MVNNLPTDFLELCTFCSRLNTKTIELSDVNKTISLDLLNDWLVDIKVALNDNPGFAFDIGHTIFPAFLASTYAITKNTPWLWASITEDEKARMDFQMRVMVYMSALASNDCNDFRTTLSLQGDFNKTGGLNFRYSAVLPMLYAVYYFNEDMAINKTNIDELLMNFDVDEVLDEASRYGYTAMIQRWNTEIVVEEMPISAKDYLSFKCTENSKELMFCENLGNLSWGGEGSGINHPYTYKGRSLENYIITIEENGTTQYTSPIVLTLTHLLYECFHGGQNGVITSSIDENGDGIPEVYIFDKTTSPEEGKVGLMRAFNDGTEYPRLRSSGIYAQLEASLSIQAIATLTILDPYCVKYHLHPKRNYTFTIHDCPRTFEVVNNGLSDAVYKLEHGYHSKAMGRYYDWFENDGWSWFYWKNYFKENIKR